MRAMRFSPASLYKFPNGILFFFNSHGGSVPAERHL